MQRGGYPEGPIGGCHRCDRAGSPLRLIGRVITVISHPLIIEPMLGKGFDCYVLYCTGTRMRGREHPPY